MERVNIIKQVFEIIKFIGKRNVSHRGTNKGLYALVDLNINYGNFLELLKFTAELDTVLKKYLTESIQRSKNAEKMLNLILKEEALITLFSKTTVHKVIETILVTICGRLKKKE